MGGEVKGSHRYSLEEKREIIALYKSGMSPKTIAETFGCNPALICYYADNTSRFDHSQKYGTRQLPLFRTRSYPRQKITNNVIKCFIEKYLSGFSLTDIGEQYGVDKEIVRLYLKRSGVNRRPQAVHNHIARAKRRSKFPMRWKERGYWYVYRPEHPMARKNGYIAEHRILVEEFLKDNQPEHPALDQNGYLLSYWDVHHKNGVKDDNRIENLEALLKTEHHPWLHYKEELEHLKRENSELKALLSLRGEDAAAK